MGPIGSKAKGGPIGLMMHNSHAFTPEGVPLGVVSAEAWARDPEALGTQRPLHERESRKWLDAYGELKKLAPQIPDTTLVSIGDREADLFELFALARDPDSPRILVRAHKGRNRRVITDSSRTPLTAHVAGLAVACWCRSKSAVICR